MNKKNLILFMPTIEVGGVEKNFIIISNFLASKFDRLSVVTTSNNKKNKFSKKINFISQSKINLSNYSRRFKFLVGLLILAKEIIKNNNNVVLCFQANIYCIYLCKLFRTKVIVRSNSSPEGWSKNFLKKLIYKHAFSIADKIIVNSLEFKNQIKKKFNVKSLCIYNPLNKNEIINLSKKKINISFFKKNCLNFINVARLEDQKDHMTLLNAFLNLKNLINFRLLIIGDGKNKKKIKKFIEKNKLKNQIKILKNIDNPFPYIRKSNIFILSSLYEGLPNVLLEAITLNKYVISSDCPTGPKEILNYGKGGTLFKTGDSVDLSKKIKKIKFDKKNIFNKIKYSSKQLYRFDKKKNLNKYFNLVNKV
tara:strand:+ start:1673 stop:2767 length:1095 start_codon:yes stop_codon:yes gene_type:complete